jgi:peptide/nickel transport system substrate-binding protein
MAESWTVSEDGLVYTITLREGFVWTDGTPVTAHDYAAAFAAISDPAVESPSVFITETISSMVAVDDYTIEVTFATPSCEALTDAAIQPIPAHLYADGNYAVLNEQNYDSADAPAIGPYRIASQIVDQQTALVPVETEFPDGNPVNDGYVMRVYGDATIEHEAFLAGEITAVDGPPVDRRADLRASAEAGELTIYPYSPGSSWDGVFLNLANPENPQEAYDADGNLIEQDPNPFFGDVRVRQALNMAIDVDSIIEGAVFGEGTRMVGPYVPGTWVNNPDVPLYEYDTEAAAALLEEAGWVDHDNDPATPRIAQGALHAEDGTEFRFTLFTNQGNARRTAIGTIIQDQLADLGIAVDFQTVDFNLLLELLDRQTFDAIVLGWRNGFPYSPDMTQIFGSGSDAFGGSNSGSYVNTELDELLLQALNVPGCDPAERAAIYGQVQQILAEDAPYIWLYGLDGMYAWQNGVEGVDPFPNRIWHNVQDWRLSSQ